jgi:hypothetical protein
VRERERKRSSADVLSQGAYTERPILFSSKWRPRCLAAIEGTYRHMDRKQIA